MSRAAPRRRGRRCFASAASRRRSRRQRSRAWLSPGRSISSTDRYESVTDSLRIVAADPLLFRPGSDYSYSSYGFNLLGAALEGASGERFVEVLRREVFAPLGLEHTRLDVPGVRGRAALYEVRGDRSAEPAPTVDLSDRYPSGGLVSTAEEVARLGSKLGDTSFLSAGTQKTAFAERRPSSGERTEVRPRLGGGRHTGGALRRAHRGTWSAEPLFFSLTLHRESLLP